MSNLLRDNKKIMKYWNYYKNDNELLNNISQYSHKKVWWICDKGHEWQTQISSRTETSGCPFCTSRKVLKGFNDLATINPELVKEWDYEKNKKVTPTSVMPNSNKKVWWKCSKGHEWEATCLSRNREKTGCPYCANQKILKGFNDFESQYPDLLEEWDYEKNNILPSEVTGKTNTKVWWKCKYLHEWKASIYKRINGSMCPKCQSDKQTSFPEQAILYYLQKYGFSCCSRHKYNNIYEIDIYLDKNKIGTEYDGSYFHNKTTLAKEKKKDEYLLKHNIHLIRVKEDLNSNKYGTNIDYIRVVKENNVYNYNNAIYLVLKRILNLTSCKIEKFDIDTNRDRIMILNQYKQYQFNNSLLVVNPNLSKEWNYKKNLGLTPDMFLPNSNHKVWWICSKGHEWLSAISWRNSGNGCPYCSNKKLLKGFNDLKTINPKLAQEWDYKKNDIKPDEVFSNSHKKVWWICPTCSNSYQASIAHRNNGKSCPNCKWDILSQKGIERFYDENKLLVKLFPNLMKEWNYKKNINLDPNKFVIGSRKKVWWICSKGHEWENTISNRTQHNQNCPYCSNQKVLRGYNDLQTINPNLASEWDYKMNRINPWEIAFGSGKKVWWQCNKCNYEWEAQVYQRNKGYAKCPNCKSKK